MARNPNRMFTVLSELFLVWKESPDLRLGQLLSNLANTSDLFYLEDENMVARMREWRAFGALPQEDTHGLGACDKDGCQSADPSGLLQG